MKKSIQILGLPIISISEGRELGSSRFLVINSDEGLVAALSVEDDKWYQGPKLLPFSSIVAIGEYAITVNSSTDIIAIADAAGFEKFLSDGIKIIGTTVITKSGGIHGKITELIIDEKGAITSCELTDTAGQIIAIPASIVSTYGKEVTVITEITEAQPQFKQAEAPVNRPPSGMQPRHGAYQTSHKAHDHSKKADDQQTYLGRKAGRRIKTDTGVIIVEQGADITEEVLQKAKLAGKLSELAANLQ